MMNRIILLGVLAIVTMSFLSSKSDQIKEKETWEYTVIYGEDLLTFQKLVSEKLNEGWQLQGRMSAVGDPAGTRTWFKYFQSAKRVKVEAEKSGE